MICAFIKNLKLKHLKGKFVKLNHFKDADYWIGLTPKETAEALAIAWKNFPVDGYKLLRPTQIDTVLISSAWPRVKDLIAYVENINRLIAIGETKTLETVMDIFPKVAITELHEWIVNDEGKLDVAEALKLITATLSYHRLILEPYNLHINQRLCAPLYNELIQMYIYFILLLEKECDYI